MEKPSKSLPQWGLLCLIASALLLLFITFKRNPSSHTQQSSIYLGKKIPNTLVTKTIEGQNWQISDEKGKVVVLDFWATWCPPCMAQLPDLIQLSNSYSESDVSFIGVSLDKDIQQLKSVQKKYNIPYTLLFEAPSQNIYASSLNIYALPSIWIIDQNGTIVGANLHNLKDIKEKIDQSLKTP